MEIKSFIKEQYRRARVASRRLRWYIQPYYFRKGRYKKSFLNNSIHLPTIKIENVKPIIYCFWTGENEMSENRKKAFTSLKENCGVEVKLITIHNLDDYILSDFPLHKAYPYLSHVHKSDYLRCYFMHHYGGGYSDIKATSNSWKEAFQAFNKDSESWAMGYREVSKGMTAQLLGTIGIDIRENYSLLIGNCAYIFRPATYFTQEWYNELHKRLDGFYENLKQNKGNIMGDNEGYPIEWTEILGDIFHPLCLKYHNKLVYTELLLPDFSNYR
ncbi:capsular polysaccharide synthesis protein [Bernardetia sp. ABR2-2B]|uniref:capsular polysaccharide synthesis protein n=1 Tax=Bernardetia sp. ABR2-2B TaxID=3127472 RepID=UPI0030D4D8B0